MRLYAEADGRLYGRLDITVFSGASALKTMLWLKTEGKVSGDWFLVDKMRRQTADSTETLARDLVRDQLCDDRHVLS